MRTKSKIFFTYHVKPCFSVEDSASGKISLVTFIEVSEIYEDKQEFVTYRVWQKNLMIFKLK